MTAVTRLEEVLRHILQSNVELSERIASMEASLASSGYAKSTIESVPGVPDAVSLMADDASVMTAIRDPIPDNFSSAGAQKARVSCLGPDVEHGLFSSFAYKRTTRRLSSSFRPPAACSESVQGWSFFSQVSLAQITSVSVLSLPISPKDLWNPSQYVNRERTGSNSKVRVMLLGE